MVIFGIIGGVAKLCDTIFNVNGVGFFVNSEICSAAFVISIVLVWLIGVILLIADRKVDVVLTPPKSKATGMFGFLAAVSVLGSGIINLFSLGSSDSLAGSIIMCLLSLLGGGVLLYEACVSFTGHNGMNKFPLAGLVLPGWACGRLITLFIDYSKVSIHATEMFDVVSVTFLLLFLFYQAMFFAETGARAAVRRTTFYGICYIMCGLITTVDLLIKMFSPTPQGGTIDVLVIEPTIGRVLLCVADLSFVLYAASFVISNAKNAQYLRNGKKVGDEYDLDDDDDDPGFLGAISAEPEEDEAPKKSRSKKSKASSRSRSRDEDDEFGYSPLEKYSGSLKFDDPDVSEDTDTLDFSNLKKAMSDINNGAADEGISKGPLSFEDDNSDIPAPAPMTFQSVQDIEPATMTFESVQDIEPAPMTFESVQNTEPAPMTFESVQNAEPAPMTFESVQNAEPAPMTFESVTNSEPEPAKEAPEEKKPDTDSAAPAQAADEEEVSDFSDEDPFADESSQEDYDEIFRLLDEMGTDD